MWVISKYLNYLYKVKIRGSNRFSNLQRPNNLSSWNFIIKGRYVDWIVFVCLWKCSGSSEIKITAHESTGKKRSCICYTKLTLVYNRSRELNCIVEVVKMWNFKKFYNKTSCVLLLKETDQGWKSNIRIFNLFWQEMHLLSSSGQ